MPQIKKSATKSSSSTKKAAPRELPEKLKGFGGGLPRAMGVNITLASKKKIVAELPIKRLLLSAGALAGGAR